MLSSAKSALLVKNKFAKLIFSAILLHWCGADSPENHFASRVKPWTLFIRLNCTIGFKFRSSLKLILLQKFLIGVVYVGDLTFLLLTEEVHRYCKKDGTWYWDDVSNHTWSDYARCYEGTLSAKNLADLMRSGGEVSLACWYWLLFGSLHYWSACDFSLGAVVCFGWWEWSDVLICFDFSGSLVSSIKFIIHF